MHSVALYICEYLGATLKDPFDLKSLDPQMIRELIDLNKSLSQEDLSALINFAECLTTR